MTINNSAFRGVIGSNLDIDDVSVENRDTTLTHMTGNIAGNYHSIFPQFLASKRINLYSIITIWKRLQDSASCSDFFFFCHE